MPFTTYWRYSNEFDGTLTFKNGKNVITEYNRNSISGKVNITTSLTVPDNNNKKKRIKSRDVYKITITDKNISGIVVIRMSIDDIDKNII